MGTKIFKDYEDFLNREDKEINGVSQEFAEENPNFESDNETNKGCWNCSSCRYCSYCSDCSDCSYCSDCSSCRSCRSCRYCSDCSDCSDCSYCSDCSSCRSCRSCSYCSDCSSCRSCRDCSYCSDCSSCSSCRSCSYCSDCSSCRSCRSCSYCSDCSSCRSCRSCRDCSYCSDCSSCSSCRSCSDCSYCRGNENIKPFIVPKIENIHSTVLAAASGERALNMGSWHTCETTHCRAGWVVFLAGEEGKKLESETDTLFAAMQIYKASSDIHVSPTRFFESNEVALADMKRCAELEIKNGNSNAVETTGDLPDVHDEMSGLHPSEPYLHAPVRNGDGHGDNGAANRNDSGDETQLNIPAAGE